MILYIFIYTESYILIDPLYTCTQYTSYTYHCIRNGVTVIVGPSHGFPGRLPTSVQGPGPTAAPKHRGAKVLLLFVWKVILPHIFWYAYTVCIYIYIYISPFSPWISTVSWQIGLDFRLTSIQREPLRIQNFTFTLCPIRLCRDVSLELDVGHGDHGTFTGLAFQLLLCPLEIQTTRPKN